ncbi:MAG TPA: hypothetical protein VKK31_13765 [Thermoanaerobaculia bacterium]|nr:hypothetical protein [Thermoanaerobaculia bacterium]
MIASAGAPQLNPIAARLDLWSRACLPYVTPQMCFLAALGMFAVFFTLKVVRDKALPSVDDSLRVALTTVTLLTAMVAVLGLLLPTPPAPPEMNEGVLRSVGLTAGIALSTYALKTFAQAFSNRS